MEKIDKIKTEYMLFDMGEAPKSKEDVVDYIKTNASCFANVYKETVNARRSDKLTLFINKFFSILGFSMESYDKCLYKSIEALEKYGESAATYEFLCQRLLVSITDDNWLDIYRLGSFMENKSLSVDNYYDRVAKSIDVSYQGIMCIAGGEDETPIFRKFFDEELDNILSKNKEKIKKR